mmetsp:Transcript_25652/g.36038  ORF Transcript_25652/g.36038 Transcript_25652/m.36038 type:complete len:214 (-) Transcript_25652:508-1149(-)
MPPIPLAIELCFLVSKLRVAVDQGGSASCQVCPDGTYSQAKETQCSLCNIGESSNPEKTQCSACPMNYFADSEGTPECLACGMPTWSSANRSTCEYNCSLVLMENPAANTSRTYNLSPIGQFNITYIGEGDNGTNIEYRFFGSLCEWNPLCAYTDGDINAYICQKNFSLLTNLERLLASKKSITHQAPTCLHQSFCTVSHMEIQRMARSAQQS